MPKLSEDLAQPLRTMQECARRIAKVSLECKLELDEDEYVQVSFTFFCFILQAIWKFTVYLRFKSQSWTIGKVNLHAIF